MKYVVITGGVVSGLGKGITASSVGLLLKECGIRVTAIKIDPYLNIDAGTMSPYEHGEVFVLDDGGEADLDLGNYERFMDVRLTRDHNMTTGKMYQSVICKERKGAYLGKTVQMIPHITDEIQEWIARVASLAVSADGRGLIPEVCMIELGGTVGDIESMVFLEALRQLAFKVGTGNFCHIHVSLIPVLGNVGEQKSKPTQHSMQSLRAAGLLPNIIVCRCQDPIDRTIAEKVSLFSMVPFNRVVSVHDVSNIYFVPNLLLKQGVVSQILNILQIHKMPPINIGKFDQLAKKLKEQDQTNGDKDGNDGNDPNVVSIGIVGKYTGLSDSYLSVTKALLSASLNCGVQLKIVWIESSHLEFDATNCKQHKLSNKRFPKPNPSERERDRQRHGASTGEEQAPSGRQSPSICTNDDGDGDGDGDEHRGGVLAPLRKRAKLSHGQAHAPSKSMDEKTEWNDKDGDDDSVLVCKPSSFGDYLSYVSVDNIKSDCQTTRSQFCEAWGKLASVDGILIPGGFGDRGLEGKIAACKYGRSNLVPFLGICLGMQMAVIEFARNVCGMEDCNSEETDGNCRTKCVISMPEMADKALGGTMRLGQRVCHLREGSLIHWLYNEQSEIYERHRHRYEVNPKLIQAFEKGGLLFTGKDDTQQRMEVIELNTKDHPFYVGCQFHPEFKSGPLRPSPPFTGLIKASAGILHAQPMASKLIKAKLKSPHPSHPSHLNQDGDGEVEVDVDVDVDVENAGKQHKAEEAQGKQGACGSPSLEQARVVSPQSVLCDKSLNTNFDGDRKQREASA